MPNSQHSLPCDPLRYSQVAPLTMFEEKNTGTNLPAQIDVRDAQGLDWMLRIALYPTKCSMLCTASYRPSAAQCPN